MKEQIDKATKHGSETDRLDRCMSMVAHHEEVQVMLTAIQELLMEWRQDTHSPEEAERC